MMASMVLSAASDDAPKLLTRIEKTSGSRSALSDVSGDGPRVRERAGLRAHVALGRLCPSCAAPGCPPGRPLEARLRTDRELRVCATCVRTARAHQA